MLLASNSLDWYMARASGVVAYLLLSIVVLVGIALAGKVRIRWPRFAVVDVHRFGGMLVGVFIGLHVATLALDTFLPFSLTQLVVPFASHYRPLPTALGIVAMELLVAVAVTNLIRKRLPYRVWRRAHYATFAVWVAATAHGLTAGTDRGSLWLSALYVVSVAAVLTALAARVGRRLRPGLGLGRLALPSLAVASARHARARLRATYTGSSSAGRLRRPPLGPCFQPRRASPGTDVRLGQRGALEPAGRVPHRPAR